MEKTILPSLLFNIRHNLFYDSTATRSKKRSGRYRTTAIPPTVFKGRLSARRFSDYPRRSFMSKRSVTARGNLPTQTCSERESASPFRGHECTVMRLTRNVYARCCTVQGMTRTHYACEYINIMDELYIMLNFTFTTCM